MVVILFKRWLVHVPTTTDQCGHPVYVEIVKSSKLIMAQLIAKETVRNLITCTCEYLVLELLGCPVGELTVEVMYKLVHTRTRIVITEQRRRKLMLYMHNQVFLFIKSM